MAKEMKEPGKGLDDSGTKEVLDQQNDKATKKAKRKQKFREKAGAAKEYAQSRYEQEKKKFGAVTDLLMDLKNPGKWINAGKTGIENTVTGFKDFGKLVKALFNHPQFYEHYKEYLDLMVTPNFAKISGVVDEDIPGCLNGGGSVYNYPFNDGSFSIPKVCGISLKLTRSSQAKVMKLAIDRLYQAVQNSNNGNASGTLAEYLELILITRELLCLIETGRRAYGSLKSFRLLDESVPQAYFAAYGLDYDTFRIHAADLRNYLNTVIDEFNSRAMFKLDLFDRTIALFRGHYADNPTYKHQDYVFRALSILTMDNTCTNLTEVSLANDAVGAHNTGLDYDSYVARVEDALSKLTAKKVYSDIRANIIKAFGLNLLNIPKVEENYLSLTAYSEYMLQSIQNATLIGSPLMYTDTLVGQNAIDALAIDEELISNYPVSENMFAGNFINAYKDKISNSEFISSTRLTVCGSVDSDFNQVVDCFGTEVACEAVVPFVTNSANAATLGGNLDYNMVLFRYSRMTFINTNFPDSTELVDISQHLISIYLWSVFDWHPFIQLSFGQYVEKEGENAYLLSIPMWDFANFAYVVKKQMVDYHRIAVRNLMYADLLFKKAVTEVIPADR